MLLMDFNSMKAPRPLFCHASLAVIVYPGNFMVGNEFHKYESP